MNTTLKKDGWAKLLKYLGKKQADDAPLLIKTVLESNGLADALEELDQARAAWADAGAAARADARAAWADAGAAARADARAAWADAGGCVGCVGC